MTARASFGLQIGVDDKLGPIHPLVWHRIGIDLMTSALTINTSHLFSFSLSVDLCYFMKFNALVQKLYIARNKININIITRGNNEAFQKLIDCHGNGMNHHSNELNQHRYIIASSHNFVQRIYDSEYTDNEIIKILILFYRQII